MRPNWGVMIRKNSHKYDHFVEFMTAMGLDARLLMCFPKPQETAIVINTALPMAHS